jgi:hypothetical protein
VRRRVEISVGLRRRRRRSFRIYKRARQFLTRQEEEEKVKEKVKEVVLYNGDHRQSPTQRAVL